MYAHKCAQKEHPIVQDGMLSRIFITNLYSECCGYSYHERVCLNGIVFKEEAGE